MAGFPWLWSDAGEGEAEVLPLLEPSLAKEPRQKEQPYSPEPRVGRRWKPVLQKPGSTALVFISFLKASMDLLAIKPKRTLAHAVARNPRLPGGG